VEAIVDAFKDTSLTGLMFAYCHIVGPCFWSALTTAVRAIPTLQSVTFMNVSVAGVHADQAYWSHAVYLALHPRGAEASCVMPNAATQQDLKAPHIH
jgi:hypothetical protein